MLMELTGSLRVEYYILLFTGNIVSVYVGFMNITSLYNFFMVREQRIGETWRWNFKCKEHRTLGDTEYIRTRKIRSMKYRLL